MTIVLLKAGILGSPPYQFYAHHRGGNGFVVTDFVADVDKAHRFRSLADAQQVADRLRQLPDHRWVYVHRFNDAGLKFYKQVVRLGKQIGCYA